MDFWEGLTLRWVAEGQLVHHIKEGTTKVYKVVTSAGALARLEDSEGKTFWMEVAWLADVEQVTKRKEELAALRALERMGLDPLEVVKRDAK